MAREFKYSGIVKPGCPFHSPKAMVPAPDGRVIPPTWVQVGPDWGDYVAQYAPTVSDVNSGYNPAKDCQGYFMSFNYQPNNNCYAYACNIATNTFPQPGRAANGTYYGNKYPFTADNVQANAQADGLIYIGKTIGDVKTFAQNQRQDGPLNGHFVALMFSPPEDPISPDPDAQWLGDYHWARCDDNVYFNSWSQKDGGDQVTNFDFAGAPIIDPSKANWRVNQGPIGSGDSNEYKVTYGFHCFMFVPNSGVSII